MTISTTTTTITRKKVLVFLLIFNIFIVFITRNDLKKFFTSNHTNDIKKNYHNGISFNDCKQKRPFLDANEQNFNHFFISIEANDDKSELICNENINVKNTYFLPNTDKVTFIVSVNNVKEMVMLYEISKDAKNKKIFITSSKLNTKQLIKGIQSFKNNFKIAAYGSKTLFDHDAELKKMQRESKLIEIVFDDFKTYFSYPVLMPKLFTQMCDNYKLAMKEFKIKKYFFSNTPFEQDLLQLLKDSKVNFLSNNPQIEELYLESLIDINNYYNAAV